MKVKRKGRVYPLILKSLNEYPRTSRMIEPLRIETDSYSGVKRIKSFCYVRREERNFLPKE